MVREGRREPLHAKRLTAKKRRDCTPSAFTMCGLYRAYQGLVPCASALPHLATSGGAHHRLATPELPPGADIRDRTSAFLDFRRLYPQVRTLRIAARIVRT